MVTVSNTPYLYATTNPSQLFEINLDGSIISLKLYGNAAYKESISIADFRLNNVPSGLTIAQVIKVDEKLVHIILAFGNYFHDRTTDQATNDFSISVLSSGINNNITLTSNNISITTGITIEGLGFGLVSGEAYPMSIQISGYNTKENTLYLNFKLHTDKLITNKQSAVFYYYLDVVNQEGKLLGHCGDFYNPLTIEGLPGINTVEVSNIPLTLTSLLDIYYKIVITVIETKINDLTQFNNH